MYAYIGTYTATGSYMVLDDPVRGELDSTYTLAVDDEAPVDITAYVSEVSISRGRQNRLTDVINPGVMVVTLLLCAPERVASGKPGSSPPTSTSCTSASTARTCSSAPSTWAAAADS